MAVKAHDQIVAALLEVLEPLQGEIRLTGRVHDPVINNPSEKEVFLLIPDLHLVSPERQKRFGKYGFNHAERGLLAQLLRKMAALGKSWELSDNHKLVTVQLGDFFDMWREFPGIANPGSVPDSAHGDLRDILYRGRLRRKPCLKATMILGNHDTRNGIPLPEIPFQLKAFNRTDDDRPFLFVTHGDAFDILEIMVPEPIKEFAVYFAGSMTPVNKYPLENWGKSVRKINKRLKEMDEAITKPERNLDMSSVAPKVLPMAELPDLLCQRLESPEETENSFFKKIYQSFSLAAENEMPGKHVRIAATGHTHKAEMILCRPPDGGRPLILMDVGAWIEQCSYSLAEGIVITDPSAQLGVIHQNDARIYQIRIPANT